MSGQSSTSAQLLLFEVHQERRADGSFIVTPRRVVDRREISAKTAMKILGFKDRGTIYDLLDAGEIEGWKPKSKRGNGKWRIYWDSVMAYKQRREAAAARGEA
jgi:hypothetical protein